MAVYMKCSEGKTTSKGMSLESVIKGDVSQKDHKDWIPLIDMKLPTERPGVNTAPGNVTDRTTSQVDFTDVEITKYMDKASPHLMKWNISGGTYQVDIHVCKEDGQSVLELTLFDVILTNYDSQSDEEGKVEESISLDYTKVQYRYQPYNKDNSKNGSPIAVTYDLETAKGGT